MPERVLAYNSTIKLIVMLCEPVHRSLSHYLHAKTMIAGRISGHPFGKADKQRTGALRGFVYNASSFADVVDAAIDEIFKADPLIRDAIHNMSVEFNQHTLLRQRLYE